MTELDRRLHENKRVTGMHFSLLLPKVYAIDTSIIAAKFAIMNIERVVILVLKKRKCLKALDFIVIQSRLIC